MHSKWNTHQGSRSQSGAEFALFHPPLIGGTNATSSFGFNTVSSLPEMYSRFKDNTVVFIILCIEGYCFSTMSTSCLTVQPVETSTASGDLPTSSLARANITTFNVNVLFGAVASTFAPLLTLSTLDS